MTSTDMAPEVGELMEVVRSLVTLDINLHPGKTKRQRRQVVREALPIVMRDRDCLVFAYDHLIEVVVDQELGNGKA